MSNPIVERIQREAGVPDLVEILAERLSPTDLQSLLLEVYRRRAAKVTPHILAKRYADDRFVRPSQIDPARLSDCDRLAWTLLPNGFSAIELAPLCPLGTNAAVATVDQNKVVATIRNTEVVADTTNVLALECAVRRRRQRQAERNSHERVGLCASHRVLRAQAYSSPHAVAHFRLFALCTAGGDEGSFRFETATLHQQIDFYLRLLAAARSLDIAADRIRLTVTDLEQGRRSDALRQQVLEPLRAAYPGVECALDPDRERGRGYYTGACFNIHAGNGRGQEFQLVDGGFTTWTQQLLSDAKERLLVSGLGTELLCSRFEAAPESGS